MKDKEKLRNQIRVIVSEYAGYEITYEMAGFMVDEIDDICEWGKNK